MKLKPFVRCPRCGVPNEMSKHFFQKNTPARPMPERYGKQWCSNCDSDYMMLIKDWTPLIYKLELRTIWNELNEQEI